MPVFFRVLFLQDVISSDKRIDDEMDQGSPESKAKPHDKPGFFRSMKNLVTNFTDSIFIDEKPDETGIGIYYYTLN